MQLPLGFRVWCECGYCDLTVVIKLEPMYQKRSPKTPPWLPEGNFTHHGAIAYIFAILPCALAPQQTGPAINLATLVERNSGFALIVAPLNGDVIGLILQPFDPSGVLAELSVLENTETRLVFANTAGLRVEFYKVGFSNLSAS